MTDATNLIRLMQETEPTEICNLAAQSHVHRRFHEAKVKNADEVIVWGTGKPRRELFLAANDLGDAWVFVMKHYSGDGFLNIGTGQEISIGEFARLVAEVVGYRGKLAFDTNHPDGPPGKLLDIWKITALGWSAKTPLREGLQTTYKDFLAPGCCDPRAMTRGWIATINRLIVTNVRSVRIGTK